jgi:KaiC/GvpD/RAD55 family RecA-like ATPase
MVANQFLEAAQAYLRMGYHPIPCAPREKRPLVPWKNFQTTMPTAEQLTDWWGRTPDANVALVLGRGRFAVDLDGGVDAEALLAGEGIALPADAPRSRTGSGFHVFLSSYAPVPDRVGLLMTEGHKPQVDIRGIGIVVAPPSIHPNGARYEWLEPLVDRLPPAPQALLGLIATAKSPEPAKDAPQGAGRFWVTDALRGVGTGLRDQTCTRLAGFLLKKGLDADTVTALLCSSFAPNCDPPFDPRDVEKCVRSIARRESLEEAERTVVAKHISEVLTELQESLARGPSPVVASPFPTLNLFLGGGFAPGELVFIGARPGVGKTALGLEFARNCGLRGGGATLVVSREMSNVALARRMVAQDGRIRASNLKIARLTEVEQWSLRQSVERLKKTPLFFTDDATSVAEIRYTLDQMAQEVEVSMLIVDYLQLLQVGREIKERRHQVEAVSQGLKAIAMQYKLPVLCLSSLSRGPSEDKDKPPTLAHLRESGQLEHDADVILLLHRKYHEAETTCNVAKNRDGRLGIVSLLFRSEFVAFDEAAEQDERSH